MKLLVSTITLLGFIGSTNADLTIEQKMEGVQAGNLTMQVKGSKVRTDMKSQGMSTIVDTNSGEVTTLMHEQKMTMKMPGGQMQKLGQEMLAKQGGQMAKPVATGRKEKVGSYDCEVFSFEYGGAKSLFWVAKNFPKYDEIKNQLATLNKMAGQSAEQWDMGGMVVKTETEASGTKTTTQLVSVKDDKLDDSLFTAPADYKEMNLGQ